MRSGPVGRDAVSYVGAERISGPLVFVGGVSGVGYGEAVEIESGGILSHGRVLEVGEDRAVGRMCAPIGRASTQRSLERRSVGPCEPRQTRMISLGFNRCGHCSLTRVRASKSDH